MANLLKKKKMGVTKQYFRFVAHHSRIFFALIEGDALQENFNIHRSTLLLLVKGLGLSELNNNDKSFWSERLAKFCGRAFINLPSSWGN